MEEYLSTLLSQIRCKKAREWVGLEIRGHIEDQTGANITHGMEPEKALAAAVRDMGDPVEAGLSLDRIHRPKLSLQVLIIMIAITCLSLITHLIIGLSAETIGGYSSQHYITRSAVHILLGFAVMLLCYRLDYSFLARHARTIAIVFYGFLFLEIFFWGGIVHGARTFFSIAGLRVSLIQCLLFSVPLYGALLGRLQSQGYRGIVKACLWMLLPPFLGRCIPCMSQAMFIFFLMALLLTLAVAKGWFAIAKKRLFLIIFWSVILLLPVLYLVCGVVFQFFAVYQIDRIKNFFTSNEYNYIANLLRGYMGSARLFGSSNAVFEDYLPNYNQDYILTFMSSYYGIAAAFLICVLILFIGGKLLHLSLRQQNHRCGTLIGCGCGLVLLGSAVLNILENLGLLPLTQTFLPFFSSGGTGMIISYALTGIALSVYRYKDVLPPETFRGTKRLI